MVFKKGGVWGVRFEYALLLLMLLALVLTLSLPWSISLITRHAPGESDFWFEKYLILFAVSGLLAILILWQARCILHIVNKGNPFVPDMVRRLRIVGIECLVLAVFYFIAAFVISIFYMVIVFVTFSVVGLILLVLVQVFRQAIKFKEENDRII